MADFSQLLQQLQCSTPLTLARLDEVPSQSGVYVWWTAELCLKVSIATLGKDQRGLRRRLNFHRLSHLDNSTLAKHLRVDTELGQVRGYNFLEREQRQRFLAEECFFRLIPLPGWGRQELKSFETFLESRLNPRYRGRIKKREA